MTPLSLGLETMGGVMTKLIERNTTVPTSKSQVFSTAADNQNQVEINVLQGEREFAVDNKSLGRFILDGIPPAPRGVPQVEVTFNIDANGIVNVKAVDKGTNKEQHITITGSGNMSDEDIKKAQAEAEAHAEEDKKRKAVVEARNNLDNTIYTAEKTMKDAGDKAKEEDKTALQAAIDEAKKLGETDDPAVLEKATQELSDKMQVVGAAMYAAAAEAAGDTTGSAEASASATASAETTVEEPVEGEVVDEKTEEKKDKKPDEK